MKAETLWRLAVNTKAKARTLWRLGLRLGPSGEGRVPLEAGGKGKGRDPLAKADSDGKGEG